MPRSIKMIATTAALLLVVGVAPAYADEDDTTDTTEAPEIEAVEGDEGSEGSHVNGKLLVLFGRGFDFSKGSALGELIDEYLVGTDVGDFEWGAFDSWITAGFNAWIAAGEPSDDPLALFGSLSPEQSEVIANFADSPPKNFGAFVSALRKHHGRNDNSPVYAAAADGETKKGKKFDNVGTEDGETKKGKKSDNAGTEGDDGDDGDTFDSEDGGDEFSGNGKNSDHPNKGKKSDHPNKGGKKNNG